MGFLWQLGLRNLLRNRLRTLITLLAVVFGVTGLILSGGFVRDIFIQLGEALIHSQSGHVQVAQEPIFTFGSRSPERYLLADGQALRQRIAQDPAVSRVMARIGFAGLLNNGRTDTAIVAEGIEPGPELALGTHLRIVGGRALKDDDLFGAMLGEGLARTLNLKPGDTATLVVSTLDGATNTLDLEVVGLFQTFSKDFDARAIRIPLTAAQELLYTDRVAKLVVELRDTAETDAFLARLGSSLPAGVVAWNWRQLNDFYEKTVDLYRQQFGFLQAMVLLMVCLSVVNTVNMSLLERSWEFGTMQAIGNRRRHIIQLIGVESILLGLIGSLAGALLGIGLASAISGIGIAMPPPPNAEVGYDAYIRVVPEVVAQAGLIGLLATFLAAVYPAWKITRVTIIDALRARA